jgi:GNAT superfamily N-acetyltransferase
VASVVTATPWAIQRLDAGHSVEAGDLVAGVLENEFPDAADICHGDDTSDLFQSYSDPGRVAWVGVAHGRVVGVIAVGEQDSSALVLRRFYVHVDWRGTGLSQALLDTFHAWAVKESYQELVLTTHETMERAQRFYERNQYLRCEDVRTPGGVLYRYRRNTDTRDIGSRLPIDTIPDVREGLLPVVVERPRRLIEAWHYDAGSNDLVLSGVYPIAVPVNYGFTTAWENPADGDLLDVIVLDDRLMYPGETMLCTAKGVIWKMTGITNCSYFRRTVLSVRSTPIHHTGVAFHRGGLKQISPADGAVPTEWTDSGNSVGKGE